MRRNWTRRCSSSPYSHCYSNSSKLRHSYRRCYSCRRTARPQGAGNARHRTLCPYFFYNNHVLRLSARITEAFPLRSSPLAAYAAIGCSKKMDAPKFQYAVLAPLLKNKQAAPQPSSPLQEPPHSATAVISLLYQK